MKPKKRIMRVRLDRKPVNTRKNVLLHKNAKLVLNEMEKRIKENYMPISDRIASSTPNEDQFRLTSVVQDYTEKLSKYMGPREIMRQKLEKLGEEYPLSSATILGLIGKTKTEDEVVRKIKDYIQSVPGLKEKLVSKDLSPEQKGLIIQKILDKIGENELVLAREFNRALDELGVKDIVVRPETEDNPSNPSFWNRKEELKNNPILQKLEKSEREYPRTEGRLKDEILYLTIIIDDYKNGKIDKEKFKKEVLTTINAGMQFLGGDREAFLKYAHKFDQTSKKSVYTLIAKTLNAKEIPTNKEVEMKIKEILNKHGIDDVNKLRRLPPNRIRKLVDDLANNSIHVEELARVIRKKNKEKSDKIIEKINQAFNEYAKPPDGMYM